MSDTIIDGFYDASSEPLEMRLSQTPQGPSSKAIAKISNRNVCGSGTLVGKRNGKSLVLTNAHVAGTRPGHEVFCTFPFLQNQRVPAKIIMAAYSDAVIMDWAVLECDQEVDLPHVPLCNEMPTGEHYTGGYPRCQGPYFLKLKTVGFPSQYRGTLWQLNPNAIGGQSGSSIHSVSNDLQYGLLTWSWGGYTGAQTTRGIWFQYANRAEIGVVRPPGLIELANRADDLESGFFAQSNITELPIWSHLQEPPPDDDDDDEPNDPVNPRFVEHVADIAKELQELVDDYKPGTPDNGSDDEQQDDELFGL